jgi:hypothetical protein
MSNLVDTPILAIHGGMDDNVPTWHSREAVSVLKAWNPNANVTSVCRFTRPMVELLTTSMAGTVNILGNHTGGHLFLIARKCKPL